MPRAATGLQQASNGCCAPLLTEERRSAIAPVSARGQVLLRSLAQCSDLRVNLQSRHLGEREAQPLLQLRWCLFRVQKVPQKQPFQLKEAGAARR